MNADHPVYIVDPTFEPGQVEPLTSQQEPIPNEIFRALMVDNLRRLQWQIGQTHKMVEELADLMGVKSDG